MTNTRTKLIKSTGFNLFLGSMISYDVAPDVWNAKLIILKAVGKKLCTSDHCEFRWIGSQIKKFLLKVHVENDANNAAIFNSWKFEEFFESMPIELNASDLVKNIYTLPKNVFNINHAAIASLASTKKCKMALTSNFDNGIENACEYIGIPYQSFTWGEWENNEKVASDIFLLLKLHGCAVKGDMVFTSEGLMSAKDTQRYQSIYHLLDKNQTVYCGYSGTGDVDIFQHLPESSAIWTSLLENKNENPFGIKSSFIDSDLKKSNAENLLIALTGEKNKLLLNTQHRPENWITSEVEKWTNSKAETALVEFAQNLFAKSDRELFMQMHLALDEVAKRNQKSPAHFYTDYRDPPYLAIPYYQACKEYLKKIENEVAYKQYVKVWTSFIDWRSGKHIEPLNVLCEVTFDADLSLPLRIRTAAAEIALGILAEYALCFEDRRLINLLNNLSKKYTNNGKILDSLKLVFSNEAAAVNRSLSAETRLATIEFTMTKDVNEQEKIVERLISVLKTQTSLMKWDGANETCHRISMIDRKKKHIAEKILTNGLKKIKLSMNSDIFHKGNELAYTKRRISSFVKSKKWHRLYKFCEINLPRLGSKYFDWKYIKFSKATRKFFASSKFI